MEFKKINIPEDLPHELWVSYIREANLIKQCKTIKQIALLNAKQFEGPFIVNVVSPNYFVLDHKESKEIIKQINGMGVLTIDSDTYYEDMGPLTGNPNWQKYIYDYVEKRGLLLPTFTKETQLSYLTVLVPLDVLKKIMFETNEGESLEWVEEGFVIANECSEKHSQQGVISITNSSVVIAQEVPSNFINLYTCENGVSYFQWSKGKIRIRSLKTSLKLYSQNDLISKEAKKDMRKNYGILHVIDFDISRQRANPTSAMEYTFRLLKKFV